MLKSVKNTRFGKCNIRERKRKNRGFMYVYLVKEARWPRG